MIILASGSRFRASQLSTLGLSFRVQAPDIDETPHAAERPAALARRLAQQKASAVGRLNPAAIVIGADQVADLEGRLIGKPGSRAQAVRQLELMQGKCVLFHSAVCLMCHDRGFRYDALTPTRVRLRQLDSETIERYLDHDEPWDCAGSFKIEARGIALMESVESRDPSALIGLPLIATISGLKAAGLQVP